MELNIINNEEYSDALSFQFERNKANKEISLKELLPANSNVSYCTFITELFLKANGQKFFVKDFDSFFKAINLEKNDSNFEKIRLNYRNYEIIENTHIFGSTMKAILKDISKDSRNIFICCAEDKETSNYWKVNLCDFLRFEDFLDDLPVNFGEFEFFDEANNWFLKIWDDDPFLYLASKDLVVRQITEEYSTIALPLSKTMIYAE